MILVKFFRFGLEIRLSGSDIRFDQWVLVEFRSDIGFEFRWEFVGQIESLLSTRVIGSTW